MLRLWYLWWAAFSTRVCIA